MLDFDRTHKLIPAKLHLPEYVGGWVGGRVGGRWVDR